MKQYFTPVHVFKVLGAKYLSSKGFDCPKQDTQTRRGFKCRPIPRSREPYRLKKKAKLSLKNNQLLTRDKFGTPAMNLEARRRKAEVCKWATAEITPEELNNIFLLSKSNKQVTACRVAAYKGNRDELVKPREIGRAHV